MRSLALSCLVASSLFATLSTAGAAGGPAPAPVSAQAAAPTQARDASIKVNYPAPPATGGGTVETDITPIPTIKGGTATGAPPVSQPTPVAQMPTIAAAGQSGGSSAATASGAASAPAVGPGLQPGVVPGQPLKTYATMVDAAKAGIDPLNEANRKPQAAPAPSPVVAAAFNWLDPQSYLKWFDDHRQVALKYAAMVLVAALAAWLYTRRKDGRE